jgi:hypothetical protein
MFLILCSMYAVIVGCIYKNRFREMEYLYFYPLASFVETVFSSIIYSDTIHSATKGIPEVEVNVFLLVEFFCIYIFFLRLFKSKKIRKTLYVFAAIYLSVIVALWTFKNNLATSPNYLFVPQAIIILIPGFYYLIGLLNNPSRFELKNEPAFWIVIGLILYFGGTLPLFLLTRLINFSNTLDRSVYTINFLCYGILFLLMIKAYLCKKKKIQ